MRCYLAMYGRLQAEEALSAVAVERAGDAWTDPKYSRKIVSSWQEALPREAPKRLTPEQFAERMQMLGMERVQ